MSTDAMRQGSRNEIRAHVEEHLGTVRQTFHGTASADAAVPSIDVLHVASTVERPIHTLITDGMSAHPMNTLDDTKAPRHLELMMTLPRSWKLDGIAAADASYWPIRTLMFLAQLPHVRRSALRWGDIVPNGEPAAPYAPDTKLCGVILAPSLLVPKEFYVLEQGGRRVEFFAAIPLYAEELELRRAKGMEHVLTTLLDHGINDLVDVKRRNVTRKRFGFF